MRATDARRTCYNPTMVSYYLHQSRRLDDIDAVSLISATPRRYHGFPTVASPRDRISTTASGARARASFGSVPFLKPQVKHSRAACARLRKPRRKHILRSTVNQQGPSFITVTFTHGLADSLNNFFDKLVMIRPVVYACHQRAGQRSSISTRDALLAQ